MSAKKSNGTEVVVATAKVASAPLSIITDGSALGKRIQSTVKMYLSAGARIHLDVVSAIWHAAKHGNPHYLNTIFPALRPNDAAAVKLYIRRAHALVGLEGEEPNGKDMEVIQAAIEAGSVLELNKGVFKVVAGHNTKQAAMLAELCETRFINPDGEIDKHVLDRNNVQQVTELGDADVLKRMITLANSIEGDTDRRRVKVSDPVRKFIEQMRDKAEALKGQVTLSAG